MNPDTKQRAEIAFQAVEQFEARWMQLSPEALSYEAEALRPGVFSEVIGRFKVDDQSAAAARDWMRANGELIDVVAHAHNIEALELKPGTLDYLNEWGGLNHALTQAKRYMRQAMQA